MEPKSKAYEVRDTELGGFLLRIQPTGVMTYYFQYFSPDTGRKNRYRIGRHGTVTPMQARDKAFSLSADVTQKSDPQREKKTIRAEAERNRYTTLGGFLDLKYGPWVTASRKTGAATLTRIRYNFSDLLERPMEDINTWVIEKWRSQQAKAGKTLATINRDVIALKACLSKAVEWKVIGSHPLADVKPLKIDDNAKVRYLSSDEEKRLRMVLMARDERIKADRDSGNEWRRVRGYLPLPSLQDCTYGDHLSPLVVLTLNTGLRRGEAFKLTWHNVNFDTQTLTVEGSTAKSDKTRHIPLNREAIQVLKAWRNQTSDNDLVFPGEDGNPLGNVRTSWGNLRKKADIKEFRWHDLRHDFASKLVMASVPLNTNTTHWTKLFKT